MKERPLIIIGAGGHGRVCANIAELNGYSQIWFLDDNNTDMAIGKVSDFEQYINSADFFVAIGNNAIREKITEQLFEKKADIVTLIHPNAVIDKTAKIGNGTVIMAGVVVNNSVVIGDGAIINTCSSVDHDCRIESYTHVSVGAHLAGTVYIGKRTMIGAGATVINNISICEDCMIGAGAVVVEDIKGKGTYIGVPARKI